MEGSDLKGTFKTRGGGMDWIDMAEGRESWGLL